MTNTDANSDDKPIDLGNGWVEKDGEVENEEAEEVLPQAKPSEGGATLP